MLFRSRRTDVLDGDARQLRRREAEPIPRSARGVKRDGWRLRGRVPASVQPVHLQRREEPLVRLDVHRDAAPVAQRPDLVLSADPPPPGPFFSLLQLFI